MRARSRLLRWISLGFLMIVCPILLSLELPRPSLSLAGARASNALVKIMPLGDSITYGQGSSAKGGYRLPLWKELTARGYSIDFVGSLQTGPSGFDSDNEGRPGWKINQIAAEVVGWLETYQPQIILLHIGTNDCVKNDHPALAPARLSHLLDLISATLPNATTIVAQIIPLPRSTQLNDEVIAYNAAIPEIVRARAAQGKHVQYVDMYDAVSPNQLPDQIHPNDTAYAAMANVWLNALLPLLNFRNGGARRTFSGQRIALEPLALLRKLLVSLPG